MNYSIDYFIKKFEAIPEKAIGQHGIKNHCILWHLGVTWSSPNYKRTEEADALCDILGGASYEIITEINDGLSSAKQNLLEALHKRLN